jgi:medium-chain acyl-[acyl-carrier-protein] hydrolase
MTNPFDSAIASSLGTGGPRSSRALRLERGYAEAKRCLLRPWRHDAKVRLFVLPHAGGSASFYNSWARLPQWLDVCLVELPGRGARFNETPLESIDDIVQGVGAALAPLFDVPFALFGHSMGAVVAFELARWLRAERAISPVHMFASAHAAPHVPQRKRRAALSDAALVDELRAMNGTPSAVLDQPSLLEVVLPIVRADFTALESYRYAPDAPLDCPMTVFGGTRDANVSREALAAWRKETTAPVQVTQFEGDHFYLQQARDSMCAMVQRSLRLHALD